MPSTSKFDPICYLARYPDLRGNKDAAADPLKHFQKFGLSEGRVPGCDIPGTLYSTQFNADAYLSRYPDIRQSSVFRNDPLSHYNKFGRAENRHPGYEIIIPGQTPGVGDGVLSPGTFLIQGPTQTANDAAKLTSEDLNSLLTNDNTGLHAGEQPGATIPTDLLQGANKNTIIYVAAGAGLLLLLLTKKKKKRK